MKKEINKSEERKKTLVAVIKVGISLTLLLGALNLGGYVALSAVAKLACGLVVGAVGVYTLITNMR
jgi:hypothetical protein